MPGSWQFQIIPLSFLHRIFKGMSVLTCKDLQRNMFPSVIEKLRLKPNMGSAATDLLIGTIVAILENEAFSIAGVRVQVDEIKQELISMKSFLQDAECNKAQTEGEETWVASVRHLTYDAEDIIDEFMYHTHQQQSGVRFDRWLQKTIHIPRNLWFRRQISQKLQKITKTIKDIPERNMRYGVGRGEGSNSKHDSQKWAQNQAESSLFIEEAELIGIEEEKGMLIQLLMNREKNLEIVSVVGMGGSGKTTLVAKCFTNAIVKSYFDCRAWITISQTYVIEDLYRSLIKEFHEERKENVPADMNSMSYRELLKILVGYLESRKYLVVLDDVWEINLWKEIRISLPNRHNGSRIILTTRKEDIALYSFGVESHVHHIQPLQKNDAWELFSRKAFSSYPEKCCPVELEPVAWELVDKCEGLPLAIVALSGITSSKDPSEWRKVYNSLNWHLTSHPLLDNVKSILLLSFNDLPYRLKHCFLYCSLFPEDYIIRRKRLIRLWIAEGFIQHVKGLTLEEVAETYLMELIFRSMLHPVWRNEYGRPKACKMHDLMRQLALSTAEKVKFCGVYDGKEVTEEIRVRRLSTQTTEGQINSRTGMSQLRSFLVFVTDTLSLSFSNELPSGFKLLRVLDIEFVPIDKLSHELVYLFNLRYLNLRGTPIEKLPESIGRLRNLETLNIKNTKIKTLPRGIAKLQNLRHLITHRYTREYKGFRYVNGIGAPPGICMLKKLQVMTCIESKEGIVRLMGNMNQLTRLGITNIKETDAIDLCASIQNMKLLHYLFLMATNDEEILQTNAISCPPPRLRTVVLVGKLEKVPIWFCSLQSLTNLYLHWSRLEEDLLLHLEELPNLGKLTLINAYLGKELRFCRNFRKLSHLQLFNFPLLKSITIEKGVMQNLQFLYLDSCLVLNTLPYGLVDLAKLVTLRLESLSMQLIDSIRKGSKDRYKVQHIPEINHYYETSSGMLHESLS